MCAINGVTKDDADIVTRMNERTTHRGPDGSSIFTSEGITLGHNRLAIIDTSHASDQPMKSTDGRYVIVYNGELYNYRELREELRAQYAFITTGDTEVLLAAFSVWGVAMFPKLRGIFSFALWDTTTQKLLIARDHLGVKPLYYRIHNSELYFSSEMVGLLSIGSNHIDTTSLSLYLGLGYAPSTESLVTDIHKVAPGQYIEFKDGTLIATTYYDSLLGIGVPEESHIDVRRAHVKREIVNRISTGVKRQLVSDRPVGMFLSGGIDSSIVLHHMVEHASKARSFSVGFEMVSGAEGESEKFNADARLAEETAKRYGAAHTTFTLDLSDIRTSFIPALEAMDEPIANPTAISQYLLSHKVRGEGVVVALGGDGGDELFGGYTRHRMMMAAYYFQKMPHLLRESLSLLGERVSKLNTPVGAPMHTLLMANKILQDKKILCADTDIYGVTESFFASFYKKHVGAIHPVHAFMQIDRQTWLPDESLARTDRSSMAHGLEFRVPLLDLDVVTYADRIPVGQKTSPFVGKKILRDAYQDILPSYIFSQPKRGWVSPGAKWLRDPVITALTREILSRGYYDGLHEVFDWNVIETMFLDHIEKRGYYLYPLWNILVLQVWARKNAIRFEK